MNGKRLNSDQHQNSMANWEPIDLANSFTLAPALNRVRGNPSLSHSAVSCPDPERARDFLFAAHLVAARDSHNVSGGTCVDNLAMEGRPSLVAQSALSNHPH